MRKLFAVFTCLLLLGFTGNAQALMFDTTGTGTLAGALDVDAFDWAPSSAASIGANPSTLGTIFDVLSHGRLSNLKLVGGALVNVETAYNYEITFVSGFEEKVTAGVPGFFAQFKDVQTGGPNFFDVYIDTSLDADEDLSDGSAGEGFVGGTGIGTGGAANNWLMRGTIVDSFGVFGLDATAPQLLDQHGVDDATATDAFGTGADALTPQRTVAGAGSSTIDISVKLALDLNPLFFPEDLTAFTHLDIVFNTFQNLPFTDVDPSNKYWDGSGYITPSIGLVNGLAPGSGGGEDLIFMTDATQSQTLAFHAIPEPGTFVLFGIGLLGCANLIRRKK